MFIKPIVKNNTNDVKPNVTPRICGIVLVIPKLNPEYDATILFGPGEQLVPNINNDNDSNSGCIFYAIGSPFSAF